MTRILVFDRNQNKEIFALRTFYMCIKTASKRRRHVIATCRHVFGCQISLKLENRGKTILKKQQHGKIREACALHISIFTN